MFPHVGSCPDGEQQATWQVRTTFLMLADRFSFRGLPVPCARLRELLQAEYTSRTALWAED